MHVRKLIMQDLILCPIIFHVGNFHT
jgi:hypothetical protein